MSGAEIGSAAGTGLGLALAPVTGGMSIPATMALGALGGGVGSAATGGGNPWSAALMGGASGLLGGELSGGSFMGAQGSGGLGDLLGTSGDAGATGADINAASAATGSLGPTVSNAAAAGGDQSAGASLFGGSTQGANAADQSFLNGGAQAASTGGASSGSSASSGLLNTLQKSFSKNPLPYLGLGIAGIGALTPAQGNKINPQQLLANQQTMNPGFYANLPQYQMTSQTASPSSQNWYTYGQRPQTPIYTSQVTPVSSAHGGLIKRYAHGGKVCGFAMGGQPMASAAPIGSAPAPVAPANPAAMMTGSAGGGASPMGAPNPPSIMPQQSSPLAALAGSLSKASPQQAAQVGHKLGKALRQHIINQAMFSGEGQVSGQGGGQDDAVPAKLSQGEFVVPADVTAHLGDGSSDAGGQKLQKMVHNVRAHKVSHGSGFPPKSHNNPLSYVKKGRA